MDGKKIIPRGIDKSCRALSYRRSEITVEKQWFTKTNIMTLT